MERQLLGRTMPAWLSLSILLFFTVTTIIFGVEAVRLGMFTIATPTQNTSVLMGL